MTGVQNVKVLVVDDFTSMRKIIRNILRQLGFKNIIEAADGTEAVEILKKEKVDLILSDWNMPKMDGLTLLKKVRDNPEWKDIVFIMVTAESQKSNVIEAIQNGVNQYIVKPFTPEVLKEKLEKVWFLLEERKNESSKRRNHKV